MGSGKTVPKEVLITPAVHSTARSCLSATCHGSQPDQAWRPSHVQAACVCSRSPEHAAILALHPTDTLCRCAEGSSLHVVAGAGLCMGRSGGPVVFKSEQPWQGQVSEIGEAGSKVNVDR